MIKAGIARLLFLQMIITIPLIYSRVAAIITSVKITRPAMILDAVIKL